MTSTFSPTPPRDEWRDARLKKALENAPDAQARPGIATREAILRAAHNALPPVKDTPSPWWKRWLQGSYAQHRMPWNAAFVTILAAGCIGLLWTLNDPTSLLPPSDSGIIPAPRQETTAPGHAAPPMVEPPAITSLPHADASNAVSANTTVSTASPFDASKFDASQTDVSNSGKATVEEAKTGIATSAHTSERTDAKEHAPQPTATPQAEPDQRIEHLTRSPSSPMPPTSVSTTASNETRARSVQSTIASPAAQHQTARVSPPSGESADTISGAIESSTSTSEFSMDTSSPSYSLPAPAMATSSRASASNARSEPPTELSRIAQGQGSTFSIQADGDHVPPITSNVGSTFDSAGPQTPNALDGLLSGSLSSTADKIEDSTSMRAAAHGSSASSYDSMPITSPLDIVLRQWDAVSIRVTVNNVSSDTHYTRIQAAPLASLLQQMLSVTSNLIAHDAQQPRPVAVLTFFASGQPLGKLALFENPGPGWYFTPAPGAATTRILSGNLNNTQWHTLSTAIESLTHTAP